MSSERRILVLEDDDYFRRYLKRLFEAEGCEVAAFASAAEAIASLRGQRFAVAVLDWQLGGNQTGTDVLREIAQASPDLPVIMITAYLNLPEIASAYKIGILDYLHKPVQEEKLLTLIRRALARPTSALPKFDQGDPWPEGEELIGESPVILEVKRALRKFGPTEAMILLEGESGTGKEVAARILHRLRSSSSAPFEALNCGAIPGELIESELFGHAKGAFTGAQMAHRGVFERAARGTVFLDEIGELPLAMQAKLLRVLEREYRPVGGETTRYFHGRVIFATNRNLRAEVAERRFRTDLYSRISEVVITMPPLRWRGPEDVERLARHFLALKDLEKRKQFSDMALELLRSYPFSSGNVRQLQHYVFHAFHRSEGDVIEANDLPLGEMTEMESAALGSGSWMTSLEALLAMPFKEAKACIIREFERRYVEHHYRIAGFHIGRAAREMGLSEKQLSQKLSEYGLQKSGFRDKQHAGE